MHMVSSFDIRGKRGDLNREGGLILNFDIIRLNREVA